MNKSAIFKKAHATARLTVAIVGDYMIAFSLALKTIYGELKMACSKLATIQLEKGEITTTGGPVVIRAENRPDLVIENYKVKEDKAVLVVKNYENGKVGKVKIHISASDAALLDAMSTASKKGCKLVEITDQDAFHDGGKDSEKLGKMFDINPLSVYATRYVAYQYA